MRRALFLVAVLACLAGCATKVKTVHEDPDFDPAVLAGERLGLGGFVVGSRLSVEPGGKVPEGIAAEDYAAQSDTWTPVLYRQFLAALPSSPPWPWPVVSDAVPAADLAAAHAVFARGGVLRAEHLEFVAAALPELRYLVLARLDGNEVTLHQSAQGAVEAQLEKDERELHGGARDQSLTTRRRVTITMEIYDLGTMRAVWTRTVRHDRKTLYTYEEIQAEKAGAPAVAENDNPHITAKGTTSQGPPFEGVLDEACGFMVKELLGRD